LTTFSKLIKLEFLVGNVPTGRTKSSGRGAAIFVFFLRGPFVFIGLSQVEKADSAIVSHSALSQGGNYMSSPKSREIDFAELSDGALVEMIRDPADAGRRFSRYIEINPCAMPKVSRIRTGSWCCSRRPTKI